LPAPASRGRIIPPFSAQSPPCATLSRLAGKPTAVL
jgi:hypothetical protein